MQRRRPVVWRRLSAIVRNKYNVKQFFVCFLEQKNRENKRAQATKDKSCASNGCQLYDGETNRHDVRIDIEFHVRKPQC